MMKQYWNLKDAHPGTILFFRLGDFYEMFDEDAREVSGLLQLTLTQRSGIPMCGIPHHAATTYLKKLLSFGKKIAICEQISSSYGPGKGLFERRVTEIHTPGTLTSEDLLDNSASSYAIALYPEADHWALAGWDVSTGTLTSGCFQDTGDYPNLRREFLRLDPKEVLLPEGTLEKYPYLENVLNGLKPEFLPLSWFQTDSDPGLFLSISQVTGISTSAQESHSLFALYRYLSRVTGNSRPPIHRFDRILPSSNLIMDESTMWNLELVQAIRGDGIKSTLLSVIQATKTSAGSRMLRKEILSPPSDIHVCNVRIDKTTWYYERWELMKKVRSLISGLPDMERILSRLSLDRTTPHDLLSLGWILKNIILILSMPEMDSTLPFQKQRAEVIQERIQQTLHESAPRQVHEGPRMREGWDPELDELRNLSDNSLAILEAYKEEETKVTGLPLKLKENRVAGYFFELTKIKASQIPAHFMRKQSLAGVERFTTQTLLELELKIKLSLERAELRDLELFYLIRNEIQNYLPFLLEVSNWLTEVDYHSSLAWVAWEKHYVRPILVEEPFLEIRNGRHPVVEVFLPQGSFVPNDTVFDSEIRFDMVTGPNMAGKSTYLRQTALIILLAHLGSYVPAEKAVIGLADKLYCRVGASDNLSRGESTFLLEMTETAHILRSATSRSVVIMDEVGRGTGTRDGQSLAWAVSEYVLEVIRCRTAFSTHYHELTELKHPALKNIHLEVEENGGEVIFLKKAIEGCARSSYGIHAAKLGGIPETVLARAQFLLQNWFKKEDEKKTDFSITELFSPLEMAGSEVLGWDLDSLSPREALNKLFDFKKRFQVQAKT